MWPVIRQHFTPKGARIAAAAAITCNPYVVVVATTT